MKTLIFISAITFGVFVEAYAKVSPLQLARITHSSVQSQSWITDAKIREIFTVRLFAVQARMLGIDVKADDLDGFIEELRSLDSSNGSTDLSGVFARNTSFLISNNLPNTEDLVGTALDLMRRASRNATQLPLAGAPTIPDVMGGTLMEEDGVDIQGIAYLVSGLSYMLKPFFTKNTMRILNEQLNEIPQHEVELTIDYYIKKMNEPDLYADQRILEYLYQHPYMRGE